MREQLGLLFSTCLLFEWLLFDFIGKNIHKKIFIFVLSAIFKVLDSKV